MKRAVLYLRVSTKEQTTDNQRIELERVVVSRNWKVVAVYEDQGISGAKGRDKRPAYDLMLKEAVRAKFDVIMAWDVSRLGRSLASLVQALDDLHANGVDLYLHQQALDTTTPSGKALYQMCGVFAEFERSMISERVKLGLARTKQSGTSLGRPKSRIDHHWIIQDLNSGASYRKVASSHGISVGTVFNIAKEHGLVTPIVDKDTDPLIRDKLSPRT